MTELPAWLDQTKAGYQLVQFLTENKVQVLPEFQREIGLEDFFSDKDSREFQFSAFTAPKDSLFYSKLLERAVSRYGHGYLYTDLCAGSGLPFLAAISRLGFVGDDSKEIRGHFVDVDPKAVLTARENVKILNLSETIQVEEKSLEDFFEQFQSGSASMSSERSCICINPPYIPYSEEKVSDEFLPVAAGLDGLKHTLPALTANYPEGARLVVEWSTLADPLKVVDLIKFGFTVEECVAQEISFGRYTRNPLIRQYLDDLRMGEKSLFTDENGGRQMLVGCLLKPKINEDR